MASKTAHRGSASTAGRLRGTAILKGAARAALFLLAVWLLVVVRTNTDILVSFLILAMALACVYIALGGTSFAPWVFYIGGFVLFAQLRGYADEIGMPVQYDYAIVAEEAMFFGEIPSVWLQERLYTFGQLGAIEFATMAVYFSYFILPHAVALALWKWDYQRFKIYVFAFMATLYVGLLTCAVLPTAPPWLASQVGDISHTYRVVPDIAGEVTPGTYENVYEVAGVNPVAAMPSLHAAVPFVMAIALWKYERLRWFGAAYAVAMVFSVVYLGEHYAVDGFAGWGVAAGAWVAGRAYLARREETRQAEVGEEKQPVSVTERAPQVTGG